MTYPVYLYFSLRYPTNSYISVSSLTYLYIVAKCSSNFFINNASRKDKLTINHLVLFRNFVCLFQI